MARLASFIGLTPRRHHYGSPQHLNAYMLSDIGLSRDDLGSPHRNR